jgi:hypothetical protein
LALALTAVPLLVVPLQHRPPQDAFAFGSRTFLEASRSLVAASLQYDRQDRWSAPDWVVGVLSAWVVPLVLVICTISGWVSVRRGTQHAQPRLAPSSIPLFVIGTTTAVTVSALAVAHLLLGLPLPFERTGLYWLTLFPLAMAGLTRVLDSASGWIHQGSVVLRAALAFLSVAYAAQFSTTHFRSWRYDAGSRQIFTVIEQWPCPATDRRIVAGTPFRFAPALEFYRVLRRADHIHPVNILQARYSPGEPDFYVFANTREVHGLPAPAIPLLTHPVSGATLLAHPAVAGCAARTTSPPQRSPDSTVDGLPSAWAVSPRRQLPRTR